jgi:hypothetical protein
MKLTNWCLAASGAAIAGVVAGLASNGTLHKVAVKATACGLRVTDRVAAETQNVVDEANDVVAEARRESKIDAAVRARLAELEEGIRAEVTKQVDAEGAQA